jgi:hypothetical protein
MTPSLASSPSIVQIARSGAALAQACGRDAVDEPEDLLAQRFRRAAREAGRRDRASRERPERV